MAAPAGDVPAATPVPPAADPASGEDARRLRLIALWSAAAVAALACLLLLFRLAPSIGLPAVLALAALPLAGGLWAQAVLFPPARAQALPEARGLATLPAAALAGAAPRPGRAPAPRPTASSTGIPGESRPAEPVVAALPVLVETPAALVARLLQESAARPESEAERREIAVRRVHDPGFASALGGLDQTAARALLACRHHPVLAADLAATARRIAAARRVQAPLPPDARRDALHQALAATAPALAAEFLEVMTVAPDLDPGLVATDLLRRSAPPPEPEPEPEPLREAGPLDERRLAAALAALSQLGPVSTHVNQDGSITLRPVPLPAALPAPDPLRLLLPPLP